MPSDEQLTGKRILITGASSGVGAAAAERFAQAGCDVAVLARSEPGLAVVADRVRACGSRALVFPVDVTDADALAGAVATVEREWGGLDLACSNAAAMAFGPFERVPKADFDRTVEATFIGAVNFVRAVLPALERTGGVLLVTGSINAFAPLPSFSAYAASKAALRSFLRSLRIELRARRSPVRIAIVNPGAIDTPVWRSVTTATGRLPRRPPEGYTAYAVADALVSVARRPRAEITVGAEAIFFKAVWRIRPIDEWVLALVHRYYNTGRRAPIGDPLWEPTGDGSTEGLPVGRPSIWSPIRAKLPWPPWRR